MKNLLYKEFKLSIHPLTYLFLFVMALVTLSPGLPAFVPLIYFCVTYTFLFIGMNKTTTTNDLFYTCNLPIKREDVVKARILSTSFLQLVDLVIVTIMFVVQTFVIIGRMNEQQLADLNKSAFPGIGISQTLVYLSVYFICYAVFDLIYLPWFYKNGKSIILNMFVGIFAVALVGAGLTILPYFCFKDMVTIGNPNANYLLQILIFLVGVGIWIGSKFLVCKIATNNLKKLDF